MLSVSREQGRLSLDFPARPGTPIEVSDELASALGARPREAYLARDILAVFDTETTIQTMRPDLGLVVTLDAFAVIVSAPGNAVDFVSRFFAPRAGISEDPVTGSAHCTLVPLLGRAPWENETHRASVVASYRRTRLRVTG